MDDVRAVMDAVGSQQAALMGYSEGGPMVALFAATYPERTSGIIMVGSYARRIKTDDYPEGIEQEKWEAFLKMIEKDWGSPVGLDIRAPSMVDNMPFKQWWARFLRMSASPAAAVALTRMNGKIDVRNILPTIKVPALILHAEGDRTVSVDQGRYLADKIPNAKFVSIPSHDHLPWVGSPELILAEIEEFLTGFRTKSVVNRVDSTKLAAKVGDQQWRDLLDSHHAIIRNGLAVFRGNEIETTGDGFFATFDGPARVIQCAQMIRDNVKQLGLSVRIGLHTGECEMQKGVVTGIAINIAARIATLAGANQILVSQTVKDLVAGSGIEFMDFGIHKLKGIPDEWKLLSVV